jgi:hypothetical protein
MMQNHVCFASRLVVLIVLHRSSSQHTKAAALYSLHTKPERAWYHYDHVVNNHPYHP